MQVPFLDLDAQYAPIRDEVAAAIDAVIDDTAFILGPSVEAFERAFAEYVGRRHCIGLNSGTSAVHLALLGAGVGPGDEVVTTPHTWISTSWAISYCGATPVFADVDPDTGVLDVESAAAAITPSTAAILPVDLYGNPAPLARLAELADEHGVALVDDAAQAHGATLDGRMVGSFGVTASYSFYPGKNLGAAGEGGAVVTDDDDIADRLRRLRDHAQHGRHHHTELGYNYRMDGIQGAVLNVKLRHLDAWTEGRRQAAARYGDLLSGIDGVTLPQPTEGGNPSWHLYVIRLEDREDVAARLAERGVATGVHYPTPVHLQPVYEHLAGGPGSLPNAELYAATCLSLPMYSEITEDEQRYVADSLRAAVEASA